MVIITRIGFIGKAALYIAIGSIAINAAVLHQRGGASGPAQISENLRSTYVFLVLFIAGIFCYSTFALLFAIFDFDQMGHKGLMPFLARFGRVFSAGFYGYIGVQGVAILISVKNAEGGTSNEIIATLFKSQAGKGAVVFLGITFLVVAIVYITYIIKPAKFRRELSSEKMHPTLYVVCVSIARVGALGRVFFFASFGGVLIQAVVGTHGGSTGDTGVLGLAAVLNHLAAFSVPLMIVTASLIIVYALWCLILSVFRRLPAHYSERAALAAVGIEYYRKHPDKVPKTGNVFVEFENRDGNEEFLRVSAGLPLSAVNKNLQIERDTEQIVPQPGSAKIQRRGSKFYDDGNGNQFVKLEEIIPSEKEVTSGDALS